MHRSVTRALAAGPLAIVSIAGLAAPAVAQIRLQGIDILAGGFEASEAAGVSGDGTAVIGFCDGPDLEPGVPNARLAVIWTRADWLTPIGTLGGLYSEPVALSANGSVVAGFAHTDPFGGDEHAFRWTRAGGIQDLGVPFGGTASFATGVSADGSVICGFVDTSTGITAFRWTSPGGAQSISTFGEAIGMSADGSVIVGRGGGPAGYRWTSAGGAQLLPAPPAGWALADPVAVSADGLVVVGTAADDPISPTVTAAYRWSLPTGYQFLAHHGKGFLSEALGASPDASVVLGVSNDEYVVWTQGTVRTHTEYLTARGVNYSGWEDIEIRGFSADLLTMTGAATAPSEQPEGWVVTVPFGCYANCDNSTAAPILNVNDFVCFMQKFATGDPYANCDGSLTPPALNVNDFVCFLGRFSTGCQ